MLRYAGCEPACDLEVPLTRAVSESGIGHRKKSPVLWAPFERSRDGGADETVVVLRELVDSFDEIVSARFFQLLDSPLIIPGPIERRAKGVTPVKVRGHFFGRLLSAPDEIFAKGLILVILFKGVGKDTWPKQRECFPAGGRGIVEGHAHVTILLLSLFVAPKPTYEGEPGRRSGAAERERLLEFRFCLREVALPSECFTEQDESP